MVKEVPLPVYVQIVAICALIDKFRMSLTQIEEQYPSLFLGVCEMRHNMAYQSA